RRERQPSEEPGMSPVCWSRGAAGLGLLVASALLCLGSPRVRADLERDEVDLSLSLEGQAFTNDVGMKLVPVGKGTFLMGSPADETNRNNDESQHEVEITKDL